MFLSKQKKGLLLGLVVGLIAGIAMASSAGAGVAYYLVASSGSTTVLPLSTEWATRIVQYYPSFRFNPSGGGSGVGQADAASGAVDIGASSSYPKSDWRMENPDIEILPVAADALGIVVNPSVNATMKMDCDMAVAIFAREVTTWEEFETQFNVEVSGTGIIHVYVRSDASGTTATFGKWLETSEETANPYVNYIWEYGHDEQIAWHADIVGTEGNPGVAAAVESDPSGIGYVGLAFIPHAPDPITLTPASLYNPSIDDYVEPLVANVLKVLPDEITDPGVNLFNSGNPEAYPIARLLFYLVNPATLKWQTIAFLDWCLTQGQQYVPNVGYVPINGTSAADFSLSIVSALVPS
ncbi:MAG: PstS family phosphate ABC transporter substrate-binding protein [Candidatus Thorarchaeota archaeon]|nr:PstS family phosphate ABC transporter substrate-binding protein [Candidatus Thorarchaeota archaeon]